MTLIDARSPFHQQEVDIFIKNGIIERIGKDLGLPQDEENVIDFEGACVSIGWMDLGTFVGEPGYEHQEDFESVCEAALNGGFTALACWPNTNPALDSKTEISYFKQATARLPVQFFPIGSVSTDVNGSDIAELIDMKEAGAVAFSDGLKTIKDNHLMLTALRYVKSVDGVVINHPFDRSLAKGGLIHEGQLSTVLGMKGIPRIAETLMLQRDIWLNQYTHSKLHVHNISTQQSVGLLREIKENRLNITSSVSYLNLCFDQTPLENFDENFKVLPPLREEIDRKALIRGVQDGVISCITSNHVPLDIESKKKEFPYAHFGAAGLETLFPALMTYVKPVIPLSMLIDKLSVWPRKIVQVPIPSISEGQKVDLTIFHPSKEWRFDSSQLKSKACNYPFKDQTLFTGKVLGTICGTFEHWQQ